MTGCRIESAIPILPFVDPKTSLQEAIFCKAQDKPQKGHVSPELPPQGILLTELVGAKDDLPLELVLETRWLTTWHAGKFRREDQRTIA